MYADSTDSICDHSNKQQRILYTLASSRTASRTSASSSSSSTVSSLSSSLSKHVLLGMHLCFVISYADEENTKLTRILLLLRNVVQNLIIRNSKEFIEPLSQRECIWLCSRGYSTPSSGKSDFPSVCEDPITTVLHGKWKSLLVGSYSYTNRLTQAFRYMYLHLSVRRATLSETTRRRYNFPITSCSQYWERKLFSQLCL